jgi:hypothetical protein
VKIKGYPFLSEMHVKREEMRCRCSCSSNSSNNNRGGNYLPLFLTCTMKKRRFNTTIDTTTLNEIFFYLMMKNIGI